jgi:FAD/FMN-containing dehydrogenase
MNRILKIRKDDMNSMLQPSVRYGELNEVLKKKNGMFFPPDPGPGAQIGGMITQGCSGTNAFRYGTRKDWVLGLTVVLAGGSFIVLTIRCFANSIVQMGQSSRLDISHRNPAQVMILLDYLSAHKEH